MKQESGDSGLQEHERYIYCSIVLNNHGVALELHQENNKTSRKNKCKSLHDAQKKYETSLLFDPMYSPAFQNLEKVEFTIKRACLKEVAGKDEEEEKFIEEQKNEEKISGDLPEDDKIIHSDQFNDSTNTRSTKAIESQEISNNARSDESRIIPNDLRVALSALEMAVEADPDQSRLWLGLSRARNIIKDYSGSVQAAAQAVRVSIGKEELDTSTTALEEALRLSVELNPMKFDIEEKIVVKNSIIPQEPSTVSPNTDTGAILKTPSSSIDLESLHRLKSEVQDLKSQLSKLEDEKKQDENYILSGIDDIENDAIALKGLNGINGVKENKIDVKDEELTVQQSSDTSNEQKENVYGNSFHSETTHVAIEDKKDESLTKMLKDASLAIDSNNISHLKPTLTTENKKNNELQIDVEEPALLSHTQTEKLDVIVERESKKDKSLPIQNSDHHELNDMPTSSTEKSSPTKDDHDEKSLNIAATSTTETITIPDPFSANASSTVLPPLNNPTRKPEPGVSETCKSYMRMADAYMDKSNYKLSAKQFANVIKREPDYLPAYIGYATSLERLGEGNNSGKNKKVGEIALVYGNATRLAVAQGQGGEKGASSERGEGGMAEVILRRAIDVAMTAPTSNERIQLLKVLIELPHTFLLATDLHYHLGKELLRSHDTAVSKSGSSKIKSGKLAESLVLFEKANLYTKQGGLTPDRVHGSSLVEIGKATINLKNDTEKALLLFQDALKNDEDMVGRVEAMLLSGRAQNALGDINEATHSFMSALQLPPSDSTGEIHVELARILQLQEAGKDEIQRHYVLGLDMDASLTSDASEFLGRNHASVVSNIQRAQQKEYDEAYASKVGSSNSRGGSLGSYPNDKKPVLSSKSKGGTDDGIATTNDKHQMPLKNDESLGLLEQFATEAFH